MIAGNAARSALAAGPGDGSANAHAKAGCLRDRRGRRGKRGSHGEPGQAGPSGPTGQAGPAGEAAAGNAIPQLARIVDGVGHEVVRVSIPDPTGRAFVTVTGEKNGNRMVLVGPGAGLSLAGGGQNVANGSESIFTSTGDSANTGVGSSSRSPGVWQ